MFYCPISCPYGFLVENEKRGHSRGLCGPLIGIIWGSILAYFLKQRHLWTRIFRQDNRTVLRAYFGREVQAGIPVLRGITLKNYPKQSCPLR